MDTVACDNPFKLTVVFPDKESSELVDIDRFALKTFLESPNLHAVFERAGQAFPFPDNRIVLAAFQQEIVTLEFF